MKHAYILFKYKLSMTEMWIHVHNRNIITKQNTDILLP